MTTLASEFQRVWALDRLGRSLCPPEKVFTVQAADQYEDEQTGKMKNVDPPYMVIVFEDAVQTGGTNLTISMETPVTISAFAGRRDVAEKIRTRARDLFNEYPDFKLVGAEMVQDVRIEGHGENEPVNGVFELFQRFMVDTSVERRAR